MDRWNRTNVLKRLGRWDKAGALKRLDRWDRAVVLKRLGRWNIAEVLKRLGRWDRAEMLKRLGRWNTAGAVKRLGRWDTTGALKRLGRWDAVGAPLDRTDGSRRPVGAAGYLPVLGVGCAVVMLLVGSRCRAQAVDYRADLGWSATATACLILLAGPTGARDGCRQPRARRRLFAA